jgi:hypothetical protein
MAVSRKCKALGRRDTASTFVPEVNSRRSGSVRASFGAIERTSLQPLRGPCLA